MTTYKNVKFNQVENEPQSLIFASDTIYEAFPDEEMGVRIHWAGSFCKYAESIEAFIDLLHSKGMA